MGSPGEVHGKSVAASLDDQCFLVDELQFMFQVVQFAIHSFWVVLRI